MSRVRRSSSFKRFGLPVMLVAILVAGLATAAAFAKPPSDGVKKFSVSVTSEVAVGAGKETIAVTLTNDGSSNTTLGSANVNLPTEFVDPTITTPAPPAGWYDGTSNLTHLVGLNLDADVEIDQYQLQFRSLTSSDKLAPGASVMVVLSADIPCGPLPWQPNPTAKQSNDYNGTGNDFGYIGGALETTGTGDGTIASISLALSSPSTTAGSPVTATVTADDSCGADAALTDGVSLTSNPSTNVTMGPVSPGTTTPSYTSGRAEASITATKTGTYAITASYGSLPTDTESFTVTAGVATGLRVGSIPDEDPNQNGVQQEANDPFAVHVETLDQYGNTGAPVAQDTWVSLTAKSPATGTTGTVPIEIEAGSSAGATFSVTYSKSEWNVVLTAADVTDPAPASPLTSDDSEVFDVLSAIATKDAEPGQNTSISTAAAPKCDTDAINTTCVTVVLPNGAAGLEGGTTISLSEGECDDGIDFAGNRSDSCVGELMVFLANLSPDGVHLYGDGKAGLLEYGITGSTENPKPFYILIELDQTLTDGTGVPHRDQYFSKTGGEDSYAKAERCVKKGIVDDGVPSTVDGIENDWFCIESESRQNDGDTVAKTLMFADIWNKR